jgi:hypothetical protein
MFTTQGTHNTSPSAQFADQPASSRCCNASTKRPPGVGATVAACSPGSTRVMAGASLVLLHFRAQADLCNLPFCTSHQFRSCGSMRQLPTLTLSSRCLARPPSQPATRVIRPFSNTRAQLGRWEWRPVARMRNLPVCCLVRTSLAWFSRHAFHSPSSEAPQRVLVPSRSRALADMPPHHGLSFSTLQHDRLQWSRP